MKVEQILNRFYVRDITPAIAFYENMLGQKCCLRFEYPEAGLELAQVGTILILAGTDEALAPFADTRATFIVDSVSEFREFLLESGATVVRDLRKVPTGRNLTVQHADGTVVEYVEFDR